ncbi:hypothetical protein GOBAR_DD36526 [Gossypium barbadense]|nr:hypothetical protein GOBAR_DD36526 [Gossypium barbadense]
MVRRALLVFVGEWKPPIKQERSGSSHSGVTIDSIYYYGKSVYQDPNLRSYFGSIRPPTRLTFGFLLGKSVRKGGTKKALLRVAGCINLFLSQERGQYALKELGLFNR